VAHLIEAIIDWGTKPAVVGALFGMSVMSFLASLIGVPWYVRRMPADYFSPDRMAPSVRGGEPMTLWRGAIVVVRNLVGVFLVMAGIAMLVLPGQGILTILVGLLMMDFPQKKRLQRRVVALPPVLHAVNRLRHRMGQPALVTGVEADEELDSEPHSEPFSAR
jgi:hypothetical protein